MEVQNTPSDTKSQANKPGERTLHMKIPEAAYRTFRAGAIQAGLQNAEYFVSLLPRVEEQSDG